MNCGHMPTRTCLCIGGDLDNHCARFPWRPSDPVDDDWRDDDDVDDC